MGGRVAPARILLVSMPWASPRFPGLGVALLRSILNAGGLATDALYANLLFSALIEGNPYYEEQLAEHPIAEAAFAPHYFDNFSREEAARALYTSGRALCDNGQGHTPTPRQYLELIDTAGRCLDQLTADVDWSVYDVVGFSVMMQQTVPSLALAKRIKECSPEIRVVFGGPNCSSPMGEELVRAFPEVDYVVEGEADHSFPALVRQLRDPLGDCLSIPGVLTASGGVVRRGPPAVPVELLDALPVPDFTPFFQQMDRHGVRHVEPYLLMEASRGCWWGQKHHCTFCSLDDRVMRFRSKSEARVVAEVVELSRAHQRTDFFFTDSIIGHRYYASLLPALARLRELGYDFTFFFEAKSNMRREHAQRLRRAGAAIVQPGIESFSDHVLALMDKGATAIQQLQCLKFLAEAGVTAYWNLLTGTPGESVADYDETIDMIPFMHHLPPLRVDGVTPVLIMRFSPYQLSPERYGLGRLDPDPTYQFVFPRDDVRLDDLAYYFTFANDRRSDPDIALAIGRLRAAVLTWRLAYRPDALVQARGPGFVRISDRRRVVGRHGHVEDRPEQVIVLAGPEAEIFVACDEVVDERGLVRRVGDRLEPAAVREFLDRMIGQRLIYRSRAGRLLNLPLLPEANLTEPDDTPLLPPSRDALPVLGPAEQAAHEHG